MDIVYLLIPLSLVLVLIIGAAFWWFVHSGQFDDLEGPAHRILDDDDRAPGEASRRRSALPAVDMNQATRQASH